MLGRKKIIFFLKKKENAPLELLGRKNNAFIPKKKNRKKKIQMEVVEPKNSAFIIKNDKKRIGRHSVKEKPFIIRQTTHNKTRV